MPSSDRFEPRGDQRQRTPAHGAGAPKAGVDAMASSRARPARDQAQYFDPSEPWDAQSAEALTRLYESDEGNLRKRHSARHARQWQPPHGETGAAAPGASPAHDRAWLEARLADVARRLQESLAELNPDKSLAPLTRRLDLIEERFSEALSRVAQRSDLDGLRLIEAHVLELAAHLEQTRGQLDRIDAIDDQVRGLTRRLEEGDQQRLDALEKLLQDYIAEWRRSEERTTSALHTLEDTVARIGDSVEAMEASKPAPDLSLSALGAPDLGSPHVESDPLSQVYAEGARALGPNCYRSTLDAADYTPRPATEKSPAAASPTGARELPAPSANTHEAKPAAAELASPAFRVLAMRAKLRQAQVLTAEAAVANERVTHPPAAAGERDPSALPATRRTRPSLLLTAGATLFAAAGYLLVDVFMTTAPSGSPGKIEHGAPTVDAKSARAGPKSQPAEGGDTHTTSTGARTDAPRDGLRVPVPPAGRQKAPEVDDLTENTAATSPEVARIEAISGAIAAVFRAKTELVLSALDDAAPPPFAAPPVAIGPAPLRQAARSGDPAAQYEVAARYAAGHGAAQDLQQALQWYSRAAARGLAPAQFRLAVMHERGLGTAADPERARAWYARAAEQGHVKAMHNLAVLSIGGGRADYGTAAKWFAQAADHGLADSQFNLAVLYQNGLGVAKDLRYAYKWLALAARAGDREAVDRVTQVKAQMAPADVQAADAMVAAWRAHALDPRMNETLAAARASEP